MVRMHPTPCLVLPPPHTPTNQTMHAHVIRTVSSEPPMEVPPIKTLGTVRRPVMSARARCRAPPS